MLTQVAGPLRVARAGLVAALVLALAALAHRVGGGTLPDPLILAALASFTLAGATFAARFRLTFSRLVAVLGTGQVALHYGLGLSVAPRAARWSPLGRATRATQSRSRPARAHRSCPTASRTFRTTPRRVHGWCWRTCSRRCSWPWSSRTASGRSACC
ncbi:hypothetical protein NKG05_14330 [Oerskovia sp. M15]